MSDHNQHPWTLAKPALSAWQARARCALFLALVQAWGFPAGGADPAASSMAGPLPLQAQVRTDNEPGSVPARRAFVTAGTNRFAFSVPQGFHLDSSSQDVVSLISGDYHSLLTFRIAAPAALAGQEPQAAVWRDALLQQHPAAKILRQFTLTAANRTGPAFDAAWSAPGGLQRNQRVAFIPASAGTLEFSLVCTTDAFHQAQYDLNFLLLTFRASDAQGRLDLPRFSNKF
jgi:hypothetical protein